MPFRATTKYVPLCTRAAATELFIDSVAADLPRFSAQSALRQVLRLRDEERQKRERDRRAKIGLKVWEKTTSAHRSGGTVRLRELLKGTGADEAPATSEGASGAGPNGKSTGPPTKPERRQEKENMAEFISRKREMFLVQMALDTKREEIRKLEERAQLKEEALRKSEQMLEEDAIRFDTFLKENDRKAHLAMKKAERETKLKLDKAQEIKRLNQQIQIVQSDIAKHNEQLADCLKYKDFLDGLTPPDFVEEAKRGKRSRQEQCRLKRFDEKASHWESQRRRILHTHAEEERELAGQVAEKEQEDRRRGRRRKDGKEDARPRLSRPELPPRPLLEDEEATDSGEELPMFFTDPQQLLDIFTSLEEQNLFLIQNAQEAEEQLEELRKEYAGTRERMAAKQDGLRSNVAQLQMQIQEEKAKSSALKLRIASASGDREAQQEQLLRELHGKVKRTYEQCGFDAGTNPTTLFMLSDLEARLEDLLSTLAALPPDYVVRAEKEKEKRRRERKRAEQQALHDKLQEDRNRRSIQRSLEAPRKRTGRKVMRRSQPVRRRVRESKQEVNQTDLDEAKYLS